MEIGRLLTAMITPFHENGDINFEMAAKLAKAIVNSGSDGLVIGGTTGEAPTISDEEKLKLFSVVKESIGNNHSLIAGTTNNNTKESIKLSKLAESENVDGLLLTVPSYNKPTQEGLYQHFKNISEEVSIPCILYNVPSRTSLNMTDETTIKLSELKNIIGIKEASNDLDQITSIIDNTSSDFKVWSGNDNETLYIMAAGGYGIVSVAGHIVSGQIKQMIGNLLEGNIELAGKDHRRLLELFNIIFIVTNPIPIRYYVKKSGFDIGSPRLPMTEATDEVKSILDESLTKYTIDLKV
ncbi:MAG: 4-hydroxy-tetrahydrodipicolinate synthase [Chloroflexi bacterium]|nr:4-hydroxy-tetrahydrodipicolinate synthase [Chloroflexota bacterium]|tara:strand:+ start:10713 stop:11600 length:888 start_codon:yes stop_codon:yes gene_type:complete